MYKLFVKIVPSHPPGDKDADAQNSNISKS